MTVQELFQKVSWEDVAASFARLYPHDVGCLGKLKDVFEQVRACKPVGNSEGMTVSIEVVFEEGESWYDVFGVVPGKGERLALDFCLISEWAGFAVDGSLLKRMELPEIASCILWEMTFYGFSDEEIQARKQEAEEILEESLRHPESLLPISKVLEDSCDAGCDRGDEK